jgi:hypothetical protein
VNNFFLENSVVKLHKTTSKMEIATALGDGPQFYDDESALRQRYVQLRANLDERKKKYSELTDSVYNSNQSYIRMVKALKEQSKVIEKSVQTYIDLNVERARFEVENELTSISYKDSCDKSEYVRSRFTCYSSSNLLFNRNVNYNWLMIHVMFS